MGQPALFRALSALIVTRLFALSWRYRHVGVDVPSAAPRTFQARTRERDICPVTVGARTGRDDTLVVTADHAHTSEIVPEDAEGDSLPTGYSTILLTADGQTLRLTYGTSGYGGAGKPPVSEPPSQQHTGSVVPVWARGPGAARVLGTHDHTDLFDLLQGGH